MTGVTATVISDASLNNQHAYSAPDPNSSITAPTTPGTISCFSSSSCSMNIGTYTSNYDCVWEF